MSLSLCRLVDTNIFQERTSFVSIRLAGHIVMLSLCHSVIVSLCLLVIVSFCHCVIVSLWHIVQNRIFQERAGLVSMGFAGHLGNMLTVGFAITIVSFEIKCK